MAAKKRKPAKRNPAPRKHVVTPEAHAEVCDTSCGNIAVFGTKSFVHDVLAAINPLFG